MYFDARDVSRGPIVIKPGTVREMVVEEDIGEVPALHECVNCFAIARIFSSQYIPWYAAFSTPVSNPAIVLLVRPRLRNVRNTDSLITSQQTIGRLLRVVLFNIDIDETPFVDMYTTVVNSNEFTIVVEYSDVWSIATEGRTSCQVIVQTDGYAHRGRFCHGWGEMDLAEPDGAEGGTNRTDGFAHIWLR